MLLVIDSGNTNVVFAIYQNDERVGVWRIVNDPKRTADEYAVWLSQLMSFKNMSLEQITGSIIASVVPETQFNLISLARRYTSSKPMVVGQPGCDLDIEVFLDTPEQVGADRLVNAVAGHRKYGGPMIILDFGTATTFDIVDHNGNYQGGVIAPGINLSVQALYMAAAKLPLVEIKPPERIIGKSTVPAMQSGIFWGYISMIEGMVERIRKEYAVPMKVIATGGLAKLFSASTDVIEATDRALTIEGLVLIHKLNQAKEHHKKIGHPDQ